MVSLIVSIKSDAPGTKNIEVIRHLSLFRLVIETGFARQILLFASFPECK